MANATTRRRGRAATATAIERAAIDLVLADGYDHVTVDMICAEAGVSQRTFFNYFKTKDAALLGGADPEIDEARAAEFVVSTGPLLVEAVGLIRVDPAFAVNEELLAERIRAISTSPELLARQMERIATLESEVRAIIVARLQHDAGDPDADVRAEADLISNLLAGAIRYLGQAFAREADRTDAASATEGFAALVASVLPKLG